MVACTVSAAPAEQATAAAPSCATRKAHVHDWIEYAAARLSWRFTSSLDSPQRVSAATAATTMRRIDRQAARAHDVCPDARLRALDRFVEIARVATGGPMEQEAVEELLGALDTELVDRLHRCQRKLEEVVSTYEIHYSALKPWGRYGWVVLAVENHGTRDRWVDLGGWMRVVRALPGQGGERDEERGGRIHWWGGSSSDPLIAPAGGRDEGYAAPGWYRVRLHEDGYIAQVRPTNIVYFGRLRCAAPTPQSLSTSQSMQAVRASMSAGSTAGYIAMRSWLRPSLR